MKRLRFYHAAAAAMLYLSVSPAFPADADALPSLEALRPVQQINNGIVSLGFTTEVGGRILEFKQLKAGHNVIQPRLDNLHLHPEDNWAGGEYGGISDLATPGWPGPFWGETYSLDSFDSGADSPSATVSARAEGFGVSRRMTLPAGTAMAVIEVTQINHSKVPRSSVIRLHSEWAVGSRARTGDRVFYPREGTVRSFRYKIGAEYERFRWLEIDEAWVAIADEVDQEVLIRTFKDNTDLPYRLFFWVGAAESPETLGYKGAFYALDWFGAEHDLGPGESHTAKETLQLIQGMGRVDFFRNGIAGSLSLQRSRAAAGSTIHIDAALGSARPLPAHRVELSLVDGSGRSRPITELGIAPAQPGAAQSVRHAWTVPDVADGEYTVQARFLSRDAGGPASAYATLSVISELPERAETLLIEFENAWEALSDLPSVRARQDEIDFRTEAEIHQLQHAKAEALLEAGEYEDVIATVKAGLDLIERLRVRWSH